MLRWQSIPDEALVWRDWGHEMVVFNSLTGSTHLLNPLSGLVLRQLHGADGAISAQELAESLGLVETTGRPDTTAIEAVGTTLEELRRFGLVQPQPT